MIVRSDKKVAEIKVTQCRTAVMEREKGRLREWCDSIPKATGMDDGMCFHFPGLESKHKNMTSETSRGLYEQ